MAKTETPKVFKRETVLSKYEEELHKQLSLKLINYSMDDSTDDLYKKAIVEMDCFVKKLRAKYGDLAEILFWQGIEERNDTLKVQYLKQSHELAIEQGNSWYQLDSALSLAEHYTLYQIDKQEAVHWYKITKQLAEIFLVSSDDPEIVKVKNIISSWGVTV